MYIKQHNYIYLNKQYVHVNVTMSHKNSYNSSLTCNVLAYNKL